MNLTRGAFHNSQAAAVSHGLHGCRGYCTIGAQNSWNGCCIRERRRGTATAIQAQSKIERQMRPCCRTTGMAGIWKTKQSSKARM